MTITEEIEQFEQKLAAAVDPKQQAEVLVELLRKCISVRNIDIRSYLDRLKDLTKIINNDECMAWAIIYEGVVHRRKGDREAAIKLSHQALSLFHSIACEEGVAYSYNNLGLLFENQGYFPEALKNYLAVLKIRKEIHMPDGQAGDQMGIAATHTNIGNVYWRQANYPEALKSYLAALNIWQEMDGQMGDKQGIAISYSNIGVVYADQGNYAEALKNHFAALKIREEIEDRYGVAMSYYNIGNVYYSQNNYPEALKNFMAALKIREEIGNRSGIADSYSNIGSVHYIQGNYPEALKNQFSALQIREEIGDQQGIAISYISIGNAYEKQGRYAEAMEIQRKAANLAGELGARKTLKEAYEGLSETCRAAGNYKEALDYYVRFHEVDKEIFGVESQEQFDNLRFRYDMDTKEKQLEIEHLRNVELKDALEQLKLEKERNEQLLGSQLSELKSSALQAQMNPHFVFNSLNSIQRYIWKSDPEQATDYLGRFAKLIRLVLENSRKPRVSLEKDLQALEYYIQLEVLRFDNQFSWQLKCDPAIDKGEITIPPMILQPFVENAIIHGLHPLKTAGKLTIDVKKKGENKLYVIIEDNGVGRGRSREINSAAAHHSLGLEVTQQRLEKANGQNTGTVTITDLFDEKNLPCGTSVEIELPV